MDYLSTRGDGALPYISTDPAAAPPLKDHGKITYVDVTDAAAPGNPAAGTHRFYSKSDGLYYRDSAGVEKGPLGVGGASGAALPPPDDTSAHPTNATYGDDFAGGALSGIWTARASTTVAAPTDPRQRAVQLGVAAQGRGILTPIPAGDFEVVTGLWIPPTGDVINAAGAMPAIVAVDASGNGWGVCPYNNPYQIFGMAVAAYIYGSTALNPAFVSYLPFSPMPTYWALCRSGTNLKFRYSRDGVTWSAYSANIAIGGTVLDRIGFLRLFTGGDGAFGLTRWNVYAPAYVP